VSHHSQVISGMAVGAQKHKVLKIAMVNFYAAKDLVVKGGLAGIGNAEAHHGGAALAAKPLPVRQRKGAAGTVVFPRTALGFRSGAFGLELLLSAKTGVGMPGAFKIQ